MAAASAIIAGAGLGISAFQTGKGIVDSKKTEQEIRDFNQQERTNPYENLQLSTSKSEQQTKANLINVATSVDALQRGGARSVLAGIPRLNESSILLQNQISQDLENQDKERSLLIARGEERLQDIQEQREREALQGLGQKLNVANQNIVTGLSDMASSGLALSQSISSTPKAEANVESDISSSQVGVQNVATVNPLNNQTAGYINPLTGLIENTNPFTQGVDGNYNRYNFLTPTT